MFEDNPFEALNKQFKGLTVGAGDTLVVDWQTQTVYVEHPEHDKVQENYGDMEIIREFLEWLRKKKNYVVAEWADDSHSLLSAVESRNIDLIYDYFKVDLTKIEEEKRLMLAEQRKQNESKKEVTK